MGWMFKYVLASMGLSFIAVRIFEFLFGGLLGPFRILRRRAIGFRRHGDSRNRAVRSE